jgi:hypothetical protein
MQTYLHANKKELSLLVRCPIELARISKQLANKYLYKREKSTKKSLKIFHSLEKQETHLKLLERDSFHQYGV